MTRHTIPYTAIAICVICLIGSVVQAQSPSRAQTQPEAEAEANRESFTVAVLPFEAKDATGENIGAQISAVMRALLEGEEGFRLVNREKLEQTLEEQELARSGVTSNAEAIKVGKLVGAQLLVTGRSFQLGDKLFVTAKLIGTETTLMEAMVVRGKPTDLDQLVADLANKIARKLRRKGGDLVAQPDAPDPLPNLKKALKGKDLPKVAVLVLEEQRSRTADAADDDAPDPAAETQIKDMLLACGFKLHDVKANDLADWVDNAEAGNTNTWPRQLSGVDVLITGKGFSEQAGQIGNLVSATGRVEINMIRREDGRILLAEAATCRAVDLSPDIAGKNALQQAGRELGLAVLRHFEKRLSRQRNAGDKPGQ